MYKEEFLWLGNTEAAFMTIEEGCMPDDVEDPVPDPMIDASCEADLQIELDKFQDKKLELEDINGTANCIKEALESACETVRDGWRIEYDSVLDGRS